LPNLLAVPADAVRLQTLLDKLMQDERILATRPTAAQKAMLEKIRKALGHKTLPPPASKKAPVRRATAPKRATLVPAAPAASSAAKPKAVARPRPAARAKAPAAKPTKS
jgi:hypothetical protein